VFMCFMHSNTLCRKYLIEIDIVFSCLMKCEPQRTYIFNQKFDCNERFETCGSQGRTCNIANHALLFMICGLHRKAEVIVQYLKEVLDACQNAGLTEIVTVCNGCQQCMYVRGGP
jgi:hypothetical protein